MVRLKLWMKTGEKHRCSRLIGGLQLPQILARYNLWPREKRLQWSTCRQDGPEIGLQTVNVSQWNGLGEKLRNLANLILGLFKRPRLLGDPSLIAPNWDTSSDRGYRSGNRSADANWLTNWQDRFWIDSGAAFGRIIRSIWFVWFVRFGHHHQLSKLGPKSETGSNRSPVGLCCRRRMYARMTKFMQNWVLKQQFACGRLRAVKAPKS